MASATVGSPLHHTNVRCLVCRVMMMDLRPRRSSIISNLGWVVPWHQGSQGRGHQYERRAPFDSLEFRFQCAFYFATLKRTH